MQVAIYCRIWFVSSLVNMGVKCSFIRLAFAQSSVMSFPLLNRGGIPLGSWHLFLHASRISYGHSVIQDLQGLHETYCLWALQHSFCAYFSCHNTFPSAVVPICVRLYILFFLLQICLVWVVTQGWLNQELENLCEIVLMQSVHINLNSSYNQVWAVICVVR